MFLIYYNKANGVFSVFITRHLYSFESMFFFLIDSGKYYLKRRKGNNSGTGQLLGTYDMFTYSIIGQKSYDIYKEYAETPVHRQALYNLLLTRDYLIPPDIY